MLFIVVFFARQSPGVVGRRGCQKQIANSLHPTLAPKESLASRLRTAFTTSYKSINHHGGNSIETLTPLRYYGILKNAWKEVDLDASVRRPACEPSNSSKPPTAYLLRPESRCQMASINNRTSTYTQVSSSSEHDRPKSSDAKKDMWSSMLDGVASGKKLPEKNIIVLGKFTCPR
jgi:hypothetical protein